MRIIMRWHIETRAVDEIKAFEYNPREITKKGLADLKASIDKFGVAEPIVINLDGVIIGGHARMQVLGKSEREVEVYVPDRLLSDDEVKELNIRLNRNIAGKWDFDILANKFEFQDLLDWGFDKADFGMDVSRGSDGEDDVPELDTEPIAQLGDLYLLGRHRLLCGDSTDPATVARLMGGRTAGMIFTDPPYGMSLDTDFSEMKGWYGAGNKYDKVIGDNADFTPELISTIFENFPTCKEIFVWGGDYFSELLPNRNAGSWVVWDKTAGGESPNSNCEKMFGSNFELCWSKTRHKRAIVRALWKSIFGLSQEDTKRRAHPTQKPTELCRWFLEHFSEANDVVVDLYGGSGSTMIAAEQTNRDAYLLEIDPQYIDVMVVRWEKFTGQTAERVRADLDGVITEAGVI